MTEPPLPFRIVNWIGIIDQLASTEANKVLRPLGLQLPQFVLLNHFSHRPDETRTVTGVARALQQPQPGVTKNVQKLVAKGWLRASHRELDPELSLPYRPYHRHKRRLYLTPGEIVQVQVEIWPTSMVFAKGSRLRLDVQPRDGVGSQSYMHYHADYNAGAINTVHAGGIYPSHILLPVIPARG